MEKVSKFCNRSVKPWLQDNDIEIYSRYKEKKSVAAERFLKTLKNKNYKYLTSVLKNVSINNLANIVDKYSNTYHITIKMKPVDVIAVT